MTEPKITANIDSCTAMIAQRAMKQYNKLNKNDKRWLDPQDMMQEGLLAAHKAEQEYKPDQNTKYSTFLFTGLTFSFSRRVDAPLRQQKRQTGPLMELDAPIKESDTNQHSVDLLTGSASPLPSQSHDAVDAFMGLCDVLSAEAVMLLAEGLLLGKWSPHNKEALLLEIREACDYQSVSLDDLKVLAIDPEARQAALEDLSNLYSIGLGKEIEATVKDQSKLKILECTQCHGKFSLGAIKQGKYFVSSLTCSGCYHDMAADPKFCFGKKYDPAAVECSTHCIDKEVCKNYEGEKMAKTNVKQEALEDDIDAIDFSDIETEETEPEVEETPVKKKQAVTVELGKKKAEPAPEPVKKKKTVVAEPEEEEPEELEETAEVPEDAAETEEPAPVTTKKKKIVVEADIEPDEAEAKAAKKAKPVPSSKKHAVSDKGKPMPDVAPVPAELVKWPCKVGSVMRYCFQRAYLGVETAKLASEVEKHGNKWPLMLGFLRNGYTGKIRLTHKWKLNEEGGYLKITDVKVFIKAKDASTEEPEEAPVKKASKKAPAE